MSTGSLFLFVRNILERCGNSMGAWGYHPMDSDSAHDKFLPINDAADKQLEKLFKKKVVLSDVGLVEMLLKKGFFVRTHIIHKSIQHLDTHINDLAAGNNKKHGWRDPDRALKELTDVRDGLYNIIDVYIDKRNGKLKKSVTRKHHTLAPRGWMCRDFELSRDSSWSGLFDMNEDKLKGAPETDPDDDMPVLNTSLSK